MNANSLELYHNKCITENQGVRFREGNFLYVLILGSNLGVQYTE